MPPQEGNGWGEYSKLVLQKLQDHETLLKDINEALIQVRVEIAMLKVKSGVWGAMAGAVPSAIAIIFFYMKSG